MAHRPCTGIATATHSALTDGSDFLRFIVKRVVQEIPGAEMTAHLHADSDERCPTRTDYRTGYNPAN